MEKIEEAKIKLALLKENFEYRDFFTDFLEWHEKTDKHCRVWPMEDFIKFGLVGFRYYLGHYRFEEILDMINPKKDIAASSEKFVAAILPKLFHEHAVTLVELEGNNHIVLGAFEGMVQTSMSSIYIDGLKPWEQIYKVNLSKKKSQIIKEFSKYLDNVLPNNSKRDWILYKKRNREETHEHLKVWNLRKQRKGFPEISKILGITIDAAKKRFYRAYELTQGKRYHPQALRKEVWCVKITHIQQTCNTCPKRKGCNDLCPDVLRYVDQDYISLRGKNVPEVYYSGPDHPLDE